MCVCACVRACVRVCVCVRLSVCVCAVRLDAFLRLKSNRQLTGRLTSNRQLTGRLKSNRQLTGRLKSNRQLTGQPNIQPPADRTVKNPTCLPAFQCQSAGFAGGGRETERCCQLSAQWPYFALLFGLSSAAVDIVT